MLKNKTHLVFILTLSHYLIGVWKVSDFVLNLLISLSQVLNSLSIEFLDFASNHVKLFVLILNFEQTLKFIDSWNLGKNFLGLLIQCLH